MHGIHIAGLVDVRASFPTNWPALSNLASRDELSDDSVVIGAGTTHRPPRSIALSKNSRFGSAMESVSVQLVPSGTHGPTCQARRPRKEGAATIAAGAWFGWTVIVFTWPSLVNNESL